jgi:hypothetical protein
MKYKEIKVISEDFPNGYTSLVEFCYHAKNKNNVVLHLLENYLGKSLNDDEKLSEIRKIILDVSGEINRLPYNLFVEGDSDSRL